MTTITTGAPTECSLAVLSTRLGQQDKQSAKDRCQIDELSQHLSDTTHSSPTSGRSWTTCLLAIPLWPHWWMLQQQQTPVEGMALSLWGQHHFSCNKALSPARYIPLPAFAKSMGRQPYIAMQRFNRIKQVLPRHRSTTVLEPLHQAILPLRFLDPVSSDSGFPHPRPTSSSESATTTTGYNHCWTVRDPTAQHLGWPHLQQHQTRSNYPSSHGASAGISQTTTNATNMATDIATMAKVIPNMPLMLEWKIIQGEFIDLSELPQAYF